MPLSTPLHANPMGFSRASGIPAQKFYYASDTASFDANTWNTGVATGGGVAPAQVLGTITLGSGTANPGSSYLVSQSTFKPVNPGWLFFTTSINIEFPVLTNAFRFWGLATVPGTPSPATPLTEACGFMIDTTGKLFAVTYQTGVRVNIQDLSAATGNNKQPVDNAAHNYIIYYRGDNIIWCIDSFDNVVAQTFTGAPGPNVNILPISYVCVANTTPPASSAVISINNTFLGDTTGATNVVVDATYGWRGMKVNSDGSINANIAGSALSLVQQSATITAGASGTCTLAGVANKTTYIRGFTVTSAAVAAVVSGVVTVTGLTNTFSFQYDNIVTGQSYLSQYFGEDGVTASAANTAIVVNFPAITGGGATNVIAWGYQL